MEEVKFHLPGLHKNFVINTLFVSLMEKYPEYFREGIKIGSFFGEFPVSLWNGGRASVGEQCTPDHVKFVIQKLNSIGIPLRFTYTNMVLEEEDLKDFYCNWCLKEAHNGMNGVILVSSLLEEYVRTNYPNMKITSSTCKGIRDINEVNEELKKGYDMVVLDYNLNNRYDLLEQIEDKERCEILINSECKPACPRRKEHYRMVSEEQKARAWNMWHPKEEPKPYGEPMACERLVGVVGNVYSIQNFCTYVSPEDIWEKYVPMGFRNFKIEGRTDHISVVMESLLHYLVKPEYQGQVRILAWFNLDKLGVLNCNYFPESVFGQIKSGIRQKD